MVSIVVDSETVCVNVVGDEGENGVDDFTSIVEETVFAFVIREEHDDIEWLIGVIVVVVVVVESFEAAVNELVFVEVRCNMEVVRDDVVVI